MKEMYKTTLRAIVKNVPASEQNIIRLKKSFPLVVFPVDFIELLKWSNGFECLIGKIPFMLYDIEGIIDTNSYISSEDKKPYCFVFGTDTGLTAFSFLMEDMSIVETPYTSVFYEACNDFKDDMTVMGNTFNEFFEKLKTW